jgi:SNF2 family DNA or RNA helicase
MNYQEFLTSKCPPVIEAGFVPKSALPEWFKPHQRDVVEWAIQKGQAALFESFGLGKTVQQLQLLKWVHEHTGGKVLIVAPLGSAARVHDQRRATDGSENPILPNRCGG